MRTLTLWQIELIPWYVFGFYWLVSSLRLKPIKATEKSADRLVTVIVMVLAFGLLFSERTRIGFLQVRFVPTEARIAWAGILLTWLGTAIAIWARYCLGEYWSARVTLKEDHKLIRTGPYAYVRHPIYTGMLLGMIGAALVVGEWRGLVAVLLALGAHSRKAAREEALLTTEFGSEYLDYRRHTGALFPQFWRGSSQ